MSNVAGSNDRKGRKKPHQALFVRFAVTAMSAKLVMAQAGKMEWEITMTTMVLVSTKFLVEIVAMGVQKEMEFAITANKGQLKGYF